MKALFTRAAIAATLVLASGAQATVTAGWEAANLRGAGSGAITDTYIPSGPNQNASLEFSTSGGSDKADYVNYWGVVAGRTLGNLNALSYDYLRDASSTTSAWLAPAIRLAFATTSGQSGLLIWEPIYNGTSAVTTGSFVSNDVFTSGKFWMRAYAPGRTIEKYDLTLADWKNGATFGTSIPLAADTYIIGVEVGVGSGWSGTFKGAVDNVRYGFGTSQAYKNFELGAVPESATWTTMIAGFGVAGGALRRRRRTVAAA